MAHAFVDNRDAQALLDMFTHVSRRQYAKPTSANCFFFYIHWTGLGNVSMCYVESSQRKTTVVYIAKTWSKNDRGSWLRAQCPDFLNK